MPPAGRSECSLASGCSLRLGAPLLCCFVTPPPAVGQPAVAGRRLWRRRVRTRRWTSWLGTPAPASAMTTTMAAVNFAAALLPPPLAFAPDPPPVTRSPPLSRCCRNRALVLQLPPRDRRCRNRGWSVRGQPMRAFMRAVPAWRGRGFGGWALCRAARRSTGWQACQPYRTMYRRMARYLCEVHEVLPFLRWLQFC